MVGMTERTVTPNRRGARSREGVLDAAERLMAAHGYEAATVGALVDEAKVPASSIYHYFGSKEGVLLAVMERGAEGFFDLLPDLDRRVGSQTEHLEALTQTVAATLEGNPDFLRLLVVMAAQPVRSEQGGDVHRVVDGVREMALERLRHQMQLVFDLDPGTEEADQLARFALAVIDGAFVAWQADPKLSLSRLLAPLPAGLIGARRSLPSRPSSDEPPSQRRRR